MKSLKSQKRRREFRKHMVFYLIGLPGVAYFLLFHYVPMWGVLIAFQDYSPFLGVLKSEWVGLANFQLFFGNEDFYQLLRNTLTFSFLGLVVYFPFVILLSILFNEVRSRIFMRFVQTALYLPHFISWVIIAGITIMFFGPNGVINHYLDAYFHTKAAFLLSDAWFRPVVVFQSLWKDAGWGTIILLAAIAGINPELYEAATVDGASRWRKIYHITLPGMKSTIMILLILRLGHMLDSNFMQIFLMSNPANLNVADVFDYYVYRVGIVRGDFSVGVAVGLFKSLVGMVLIILANKLSKAVGEDGVF